MPDFLLPDLGEGLAEAEIVAWLVEVGDVVFIDQPVVEVETAKAVVEVPVPYAGRVTAVYGAPGQALAVGTPLITVADAVPGAQERPVVAVANAGRKPGREGIHEVDVVTLSPARDVSAAEESSGNVLIGYGTGAPSPRRRRAGPPAAATATAAPISVALEDLPQSPAATPQPPPSVMGVRVAPGVTPSDNGSTATASTVWPVISPVVRKLARDAGIDLNTLTPTGSTGTIRRADVEQAILARHNPAPRPATEVSPAAEPSVLKRIPITGLRRLIAEKMSTSRREIPEATVWVDVDATGLLAARAVINRRNRDRPVSILALFSRFAVLGLRSYPELNAHIDGGHIVIPTAIHLGLAAQTERGLVVPVVRDAQNLSTRELSAAIGERASAARAGKLTPQQLSGGTFTVNNYGVFGVDGSAAIINYPEVAILGLGQIVDRPWVVDGQVVARKVAQLALAFDHRVCDGGVAGGFLRFVADCVEAPAGALGEL